MDQVSSVTNRLYKEGKNPSKVTKRLIPMCISHCLSNAGDKADFVLLNLLWGLVQKVFSQLVDAESI